MFVIWREMSVLKRYLVIPGLVIPLALLLNVFRKRYWALTVGHEPKS